MILTTSTRSPDYFSSFFPEGSPETLPILQLFDATRFIAHIGPSTWGATASIHDNTTIFIQHKTNH